MKGAKKPANVYAYICRPIRNVLSTMRVVGSFRMEKSVKKQ